MTSLRILLFLALLSCLHANASRSEPISAEAISVVDGDTIYVGPQKYRMVGYDTPEIATPRRKVSAEERTLATIAKERFIELLHSGQLDLNEVDCACPTSTIGTMACNYGRKCAILSLNGKNIGETLIAEELAMPLKCSASHGCKMPNWPMIIESQFPGVGRK